MQIKVDLFCGLSTTPQWQSWLYKFSPVLYQELAEHLRVSSGCAHNREKMMELMGKIKQVPLGWSKLIEFLHANFPNMLETEAQAAFPGQPAAQYQPVPFESYNPKLLTFPRRFIIHGESSEDAAQQARQFVADKSKWDFVVVGDRAFVEYVPASHSKLADSIPGKNWLVTQFRRSHGI